MFMIATLFLSTLLDGQVGVAPHGCGVMAATISRVSPGGPLRMPWVMSDAEGDESKIIGRVLRSNPASSSTASHSNLARVQRGPSHIEGNLVRSRQKGAAAPYHTDTTTVEQIIKLSSHDQLVRRA